MTPPAPQQDHGKEETQSGSARPKLKKKKKKGKKTLNVSSVQCLSLGFSQLPLLDVELDSTLSVQHVVRCNAQAPLPV